MFSPADYELAARILQVPVPRTQAEMAAATPMVARVMRDFGRGGAAPMPGMEPEGLYTGATHSLNGYPDVDMPMEKAQLASRLRTETMDPRMDEYLIALLSLVEGNPEIADMLMTVLEKLDTQSDEHMDRLSSQRPAEFDTPNLGANYSMLNAPCSNGIAPSEEYQPLS